MQQPARDFPRRRQDEGEVSGGVGGYAEGPDDERSVCGSGGRRAERAEETWIRDDERGQERRECGREDERGPTEDEASAATDDRLRDEAEDDRDEPDQEQSPQ